MFDNLRKIVALVRETYGVSVSKRILRNFDFSWRIAKKPKGEPDPVEYSRQKWQ